MTTRAFFSHTLVLSSLIASLGVSGGCASEKDDVSDGTVDAGECKTEADCPTISYEPCAGKACGASCTVCDPTDPDCVETSVIKYCHSDGSCAPTQPTCNHDPCATVHCASGTHCSAGHCVPNEHVFCGGIAAHQCPGSGTCVDHPNDHCDPLKGGADCGGLCQCNALGLCVQGFHWDSSSTVCGCVPDQ